MEGRRLAAEAARRRLIATRVLAWLPLGLVAVGWLVIGWRDAEHAMLGPIVPLVLLATAGTLASLHRPGGEGGSLALGLMVVPLVVHGYGIANAMVVAVAVTWAADWGRQRMRGRHALATSPTEPQPWFRQVLESATAAAAGTMVAGLAAVRWVDLGTTPLGGWWLLPPVLYAATWHGARRLMASGQGSAAVPTARMMATLVGMASWWLGTAVASLVLAQGWLRVAPVFVALVLLGAEAGRVAFLRGMSDGRVADFERLQHAHQRILAEISGMGGIAAQIMIECANVLPVHTFQLITNEPGGRQRSFVAAPDRNLAEGEPSPPSKPPSLPGIHRRAQWRVIEHALVLDPGDHPPEDVAGSMEGDERLGTLRLWCDPRRVDPGSEELLATLIPHMASALQRARLDREAKLDPLTELPVRRVLDSRLQQVYRRCFDAGQSMAVVLCDIDHFKNINDTYGHEAGDQALVAVARALDGARRDTDLCCRYGGEEFTVLLEATGGDRALQLAERLRAAVEAIDCRYEGERMPLRLSAGVASFPELHVKTASELLVLADEALYAAKENGRNRCLLYLGHGQFRDAGGADYQTEEPEAPVALPRIFG